MFIFKDLSFYESCLVMMLVWLYIRICVIRFRVTTFEEDLGRFACFAEKQRVCQSEQLCSEGYIDLELLLLIILKCYLVHNNGFSYLGGTYISWVKWSSFESRKYKSYHSERVLDLKGA